MFKRKQVFQDAGAESLFLWGARQTGKTSLLKERYPNALWFDSSEDYIWDNRLL
ncbi:hypothetical protein [Sphingobacterium yanglingense]|uniref:AAA domain-containing protein n=1 Tax=Sphingobacterium yanglingense TaxID=1437280 RepID=A0A4R6WNT6_9SPHI|nr:hypothetical protein [Sphingobacterium yanglingense]TDQ82834.1 hypothetical protein CLV99_0056 [Sphingobacterium yanglingense]